MLASTHRQHRDIAWAHEIRGRVGVPGLVPVPHRALGSPASPVAMARTHQAAPSALSQFIVFLPSPRPIELLPKLNLSGRSSV